MRTYKEDLLFAVNETLPVPDEPEVEALSSTESLVAKVSSAADEALATKDYVDDKASTSGSSGTRRVSFTANGTSSFQVGTMANTAGKSYYVSRVLVKVTTAFTGADELVVSDGTNTLMATTDADLSEGGLYIVDLGFESATTGGATITATIQNSGASASPSVGACIVTAEYKQI